MKLLRLAILFALINPIAAARAAAPAPKTKIVASGQCLMTAQSGDPKGNAFIGAVAAIVLPVLVELAVDAVVADLKKVRTLSSSGNLEMDLYQTGAGKTYPELQFPRCLTILTGNFADDAAVSLDDVKTDIVDKLDPEAGEDRLLARLNENGIAAAKGGLYSIVEVAVVPSNDRTAFQYEPRYVRVLQLMPGNRAAAQGLVLNLSLSGPGAAPNGTVYSLAPLSLGSVSAGFELHHESTDPVAQRKLAALRSGYLALPGMNDLSYRAYVRDIASGKTGRSYMPSNLKAELVQTQKPSDAALFVASVLDKSKAKTVEKAGTTIAELDPFKASQALLDAKIAVATAASELAEATAANNEPKKALATLKLEKANAALADLQ